MSAGNNVCHGCYWWNFKGMNPQTRNIFGLCGNEDSGKKITYCDQTCDGYKDREALKAATATFAIGQRVKVNTYDLPSETEFTGTIRILPDEGKSMLIQVELDQEFNGAHDCAGKVPSGNGWNVLADELEPLNKATP